MAGKARVHELAKEFGLSSKQVLNKLHDLGAYVKSPSSTVEASVARTLRTELGEPRTPRRSEPGGARPRRVGPAGPAGPVGGPAPRPASVPPQRPRHESIEEQARRMRAEASNTGGPRRRPATRVGPIAEVILAWSPSLRGYAGEPIDPMVFEWEKGWAPHFFPDEVRAWLDAGLSPNQYAKAVELHDEGWTPQEWARRHGRRPGA